MQSSVVGIAGVVKCCSGLNYLAGWDSLTGVGGGREDVLGVNSSSPLLPTLVWRVGVPGVTIGHPVSSHLLSSIPAKAQTSFTTHWFDLFGLNRFVIKLVESCMVGL